MKKKLIASVALSAFLLTGVASPAMAAQQVKVTLPTFKVTLNQYEMENKYNQYPLIVYKDITYFPMTYHYADFLGLKTNWANNTLTIDNEEHPFADYSDWYAQEATNKNSYTATVATSNIVVNGKNIKNSQEKYPLLVFRDVTYFPLTWRFAVDEFGWMYSFDSKNGLNIYSKKNMSPHQYPTQYFTAGDVKISYPSSTFDQGAKFTYQKGNGKVNSFSLESQLMDGDYDFGNQVDENGYNNPEPSVKPSLEGNIFSLPSVKQDKNGKEENVTLKIDMEQGKIISKDPAPLLPVKNK